MRLVAFRKKDAAYCPTRSMAPSKSLEQNSYIFWAWNSSESRAQRPYKPSPKHFLRFFYIITVNLLIIQKFVSRIEWKKLLIKPITESPRNKPVEPPISASNRYLVRYSEVKLLYIDYTVYLIHIFVTDVEVAGYVADSLWMISIPRSSSSEDLKYNDKKKWWENNDKKRSKIYPKISVLGLQKIELSLGLCLHELNFARVPHTKKVLFISYWITISELPGLKML